MNKALAVAIGGVLVAGAAVGAYRSGLVGTPYARVTSATPILIKEDVFADVVDTRPVTRTEQVTQQVCEDRVVQTRAPERFGNKDGALVGAVVGGLLGNQVGKGDGRKLATVAGAVGGGYAGREIDRRHEGGRMVATTQRICREESRPRTTTVGYDVQYRSDGLLVSKRLEHDPGDRILIGQRDRVIGYEVSWRYRDQRGSLRMDHDPGPRLAVKNGVVVVTPADHLAMSPAR
ncbi:glycine zipper 2TM domain-containing protein [Arenimonas sp.]|uniref:glycine zipper 2TM domain-containing protein n=1 Tax=Arenimonas sp. TaxID=1872635 RepID=UPI0039E2A629